MLVEQGGPTDWTENSPEREEQVAASDREVSESEFVFPSRKLFSEVAELSCPCLSTMKMRNQTSPKSFVYWIASRRSSSSYPMHKDQSGRTTLLSPNGLSTKKFRSDTKLVRKIDERHTSKIRILMPAWLPHLRQQPAVCHNFVFNS